MFDNLPSKIAANWYVLATMIGCILFYILVAMLLNKQDKEDAVMVCIFSYLVYQVSHNQREFVYFPSNMNNNKDEYGYKVC